MYLKNKKYNKNKKWITHKKALLVTATAAFVAISGGAQAKLRECEPTGILGIGSNSLTKMHTHHSMDKSEIGPLDLPLPETLKNLSAKADLVKGDIFPAIHVTDSQEAAQYLKKFDRLPTANVLDFAKLAYSTNQDGEWSEEEREIYGKLAIEEGWEICPFTGTTGAATNQVESTSGFIAFKEDHVVIATRGTEMTNLNDWMTNIRFSRSPFLRMFSSEERQKVSAATEQTFGFGGEIANGFLQTHLSSWDFVREAIRERSEFLGVSPGELKITVTGHSLGGAKAQLIGANLVTEPVLDIGVHKIEGSFIGEDGFYSPSVYSKPENPQNIEVIVFGSPNVFTDEAAEEVEKILGQDVYRVENNDMKFLKSLDLFDMTGDIVPSLPPRFLGFKPVGKRIGDEGKYGVSLGRHMMSNISDAALNEVDKARLETLRERQEIRNIPINVGGAPAA